jgi:hypothetical protein
MAAVWAASLAVLTGRPVEAERWADAVDRWQHGDPARADNPAAEAWAALLRALMCRRGAGQMRADADEAARRFEAENIAAPGPALLQGIARILGGDLEGGDAFSADAVSIGEKGINTEVVAEALAERAMLAMARPSGAGPRSLLNKQPQCCPGPGSRARSCPRCEPVPPCTVETPRRYVRNSSVPNVFGPR